MMTSWTVLSAPSAALRPEQHRTWGPVFNSCTGERPRQTLIAMLLNNPKTLNYLEIGVFCDMPGD